jgi:outer membrane protein assembly factor BamB
VTRSVALSLSFAFLVPATVLAQTPDGEELFEDRCATCHTPPGVDRAPTIDALRAWGAEAVVSALTNGLMQVEGEDLTPSQRVAIARFVAGAPAPVAVDNGLWACGGAPMLGDPLAPPYWSGWGAGAENQRFQPAEHARLTAEQVPGLTLRWAVGFADTTSMWAQPTVAGGHLFIGSQEGTVSALAANPVYPCCTFRGSVVALDAQSGDEIWKTYVIPDVPAALDGNAAGRERFGPAGAAIWSAATLDVKRGALYVGTGNAYTQPAAATSDAAMALDMDTGAIRWVNQITLGDAFITGCRRENPNCPEDAGPDHDFGASPALVTMTNGRDLLVVGQKSGGTYGLDPDAAGAVVWEYVAGPGSALGGIEWGFAVDGDKAYFANSGMLTAEPGGLSAVRLRTGELVWYAEPPPPLCAESAKPGAGAAAGGRGGRGGLAGGCTPALPAAITAIPGVLFSGSNDGGLRAHSAETGDVLWTFDANGDFETVNGVAASGGSFNGPGPVVVDGMVYVGVGYRFIGSRPGNVLWY